MSSQQWANLGGAGVNSQLYNSYVNQNQEEYNAGLDEGFKKYKFDIEIDNAYGKKADSAAPATDATLVEMKNKLPTLKGIYPKTGYAQ